MYCGPLATIIECHGGNLNCRVVVKRGLRSFFGRAAPPDRARKNGPQAAAGYSPVVGAGGRGPVTVEPASGRPEGSRGPAGPA